MFHRDATVNQGQGDASPSSFLFSEIWINKGQVKC